MEKGEGVAFAKKYEVKIFPTLLYFNPQGKMVHKTVGATPAKILLKRGANALSSETQLYALKLKYQKGERGQAFLKNYVDALFYALEDCSIPADIYLNKVGRANWTKPEHWNFIKTYVLNSFSEAFRYVFKNQDKFSKIESKENIKKYISNVLLLDKERVVQSKDETKLKAFSHKLKQIFEAKADKHVAEVEYMFYANNKGKALQYACKYFDNYCDNAYEFNGVAWNYYQKYNDKQHLEKALEWVKRSIKLMKKPFNTDTQAHILFKMKRYKEAKKVAEESIALAKKVKQDASETEKLLAKINAQL